jgi:secondary thiamine-phosphate synthase enzyme
VQTRELTVSSSHGRGLVDLTGACVDYLRDVAEDADGMLHLFAPHATAGLLIMELGSGSEADLMEALDRLLPRDDRWRHRHGSPGHGADHVLPLLVSPSLLVPVLHGRMALGTWQSVALLDPNADHASRTVRLSFLPG